MNKITYFPNKYEHRRISFEESLIQTIGKTYGIPNSKATVIIDLVKERLEKPSSSQYFDIIMEAVNIMEAEKTPL